MNVCLGRNTSALFRITPEAKNTMKKILEQFNREDTYLIISDYPEPVTGEGKNHGIAWHTKETTLPFIKTYGHRFVVLAEKGKHKKPEVHEDNHLLVLRVFDQRHHSLFPTILRWLRIFSNIRTVYIHSEFCTSGGIRNVILLIPFLLLIKAMGRKIIYFEHNVVSHFDPLATHFGLKPKSAKIAFFNFGIHWYYRCLGILVDTVVVMDKILKIRMSKYVNEKKIICKPFWIEKKKYQLNKKDARKKLKVSENEFLIIYFGFISWYKGADWLIGQVRNIMEKKPEGIRKKIRLILVGGKAYSLKDKAYYKKFYRELLVNAGKNIQITGFMREDEVGKYFTAADLIVFPYRGYFGASGTLSYAFAYGKPVLLSRHMAEVFQNEDMSQALHEAQLQEKDILFDPTTASFTDMLKKVQKQSFLTKLESFSNIMADKRNMSTLMPRFNADIYQTDERVVAPLPIPVRIAETNR